MTWLSDLAAVVQLASLVEDRTRSEQKALERVALRVDRDLNRQTVTMRSGAGTPFAPPCTYPVEIHDRDCPGCSGDGVAVEPEGGWSRLTELVAAPTDDQQGVLL